MPRKTHAQAQSKWPEAMNRMAAWINSTLPICTARASMPVRVWRLLEGEV